MELFFRFDIVADGNVYLAREGQSGQEWFGQGSFTRNADNGGNCELYGDIKTIKITVFANIFFHRAVTAVQLRDCEKLESFELLSGKNSFHQIEISGCPLLEKLAFNDCGNAATLKATNSPNFKSWNDKNLFTSLELDNTGVEKIEGDKLQTVKLTNCPQLTKVSSVSALNSLTATSCPKLNTIEASALQTLKLESCGISTLTAPTSLTSLDVKDCASLTRLEAKGCSQLPAIKVSGCTSLTNVEAANCAALTEISVPNCGQAMTLKAENCPKLPKLEGLKSVQNLQVNSCASLTKIDADACSKLATLEAKGCTKLENLYAKECPLLTKIDVANSGTEKFYISASKCSQLRSIENISKLDIANITGCANFETVDTQNATLLKRLLFRDCGKLEKVNGKNALRELEVENCSKFATLEGMDALETLKLEKSGSPEELSLGRSLQWLIAKDCAKLKKVTAKNAAQLTKIELSGCSDVALEASDCSKLSTLNVGNSVKSLTVKSCAALSSLNGGAKVQTLTVERCAQLSTLSAGSDLESLTLLGCGKISSLDNVSSVRDLSVDACSDIRSLSWSRKSNLRSLSLKSCGSLANVAVDHCDNLQTVVVSACANLNKFDVNNSKKVTSVEANPCKEVNTEGCSALATLKVGNNLQTLQAGGCTKLTKVEGTLTALTSLQCNYNTGFTTDFLKGVLEGSTAPKLEVCEAQYVVNLPAQLNVRKSLKKLDLSRATGLTSLTVQEQSALEDLSLPYVRSLTELNVLQAKNLKKLIFHDTEVKKVSLAGLTKLEEVYMAGGYPARLLTELICQLPNRLNLAKGSFKYNFGSSELPLVNGSCSERQKLDDL